MLESVAKLLEQPPLYAEMEVPFWDDEHISNQMLKAHLDPDCNGATRKLSFIQKSVAWITETVPPEIYHSLLDVGCGPGIYAEKFALNGFEVTGIDFSKRSIHYAQNSAKQQKLNIDYVYQNYLELQLENRFDFATMIYCDYGVLSPANRETVLRNIYRQLKPGGKFLMDVFSMEQYHSFLEAKTWETHLSGGFWRKESHLELNARYKYPEGVTLEQFAILTGQDNAVYYIWNTYYSAQSLIKEVSSVGFKVCHVFGDVSGYPYHKDSPTIAILLEK